MSISRTGRNALLLVVSAASLAACGSTVQQKGQAYTGNPLVQDPAATAPATEGTDPTLGGGDVLTSSPGSPTAAATTGPRSTGGGTTSTGSTVTSGVGNTSGSTKAATTTTKTVTGTVIKTVKPSIAATGRGWDKDYVYVGLVTANDVNAVARQLGLKSIDGGDQEGEATAMVNAINSNGGLFGRKIKLVFHDLKGNDVVTAPETTAASTCAYFSQDHPVIAVLSPVGGIDVNSFRTCLAKAKVALFSVNTSPMDNVVGQSLAPYYYSLATPSWNSLAPAMVRTLKGQGYFSGWDTGTNSPGTAATKVGVLVGTTDVAARVGNLVANSLKAAGYSVLTYSNDSTQDYSSAVLKMKGSGITHMLIPDAGQTLFMATAASQSYFPRYGITSDNGPTAALEPNVPAAVLHGAIGVGWSPSLDVSDANDPGDTSVAETTCKSIYTKAGFDFIGRRLAEAVAYSYCDGLRIISEGAVAGVGLTPLSIYQGVVTIAPTFKSALSFGSGLNQTHLTIPGGLRPFAYVNACSCFKYSSTKTVGI